MIRGTKSYIEGIATALSGRDGITVEANEKAPAWYSDVKKKTIFYNPRDLLTLPSQVIKGLTLHETAHIKHSTPAKDTEINTKYEEAMQSTYNSLEDIRIENAMVDHYGDYAVEGFEASNMYATYNMAEAATSEEFAKSPRLTQFLTAVSIDNVQQHGSLEIKNEMYRCERKIHSGMDEKVLEKYSSLRSIINENIRKAKSTEDIQKFVDDVLYPHIKEYIEEYPQNKSQEMQSKHVKSRGMGKTPPRRILDTRVPSDEELDLLLAPYIRTLARRLEDILKEKQSTRYTGSHKSGNLLSKNAFKVLADEVRIFSKKTNPNKPHYVVTLVLDESGSMKGERMRNSYIGAYLIKRASEKLGFDVKIIKYADSATQIKNMRDYVDKFEGGGNDEQEAIDLIEKITDKKDDNLVFFVTDGGCPENLRPQLEKMTQEGYSIVAIAVGLNESNKNDKEFLGWLRRNYPSTVVCSDVSEVPSKMIAVMRGMIHR